MRAFSSSRGEMACLMLTHPTSGSGRRFAEIPPRRRHNHARCRSGPRPPDASMTRVTYHCEYEKVIRINPVIDAVRESPDDTDMHITINNRIEGGRVTDSIVDLAHAHQEVAA